MSLIITESPCLVLGAGGHAKVVIEALRSRGQEIVGVLTPDLEVGSALMGVPVLGGDEVVDQYKPENIQLINGVGSIPGNIRRWGLAKQMRQKLFQFGVIVHKNTTIAADVTCEEGVQLMAGVTIQPGCSIGVDSVINTGAVIDHGCEIGEGCHIAPGATLSGDVKVGNHVHIGTGAQVIQGVRIGNNTVIAAGITVYKDMPDGVLVRSKAELVMEPLKD